MRKFFLLAAIAATGFAGACAQPRKPEIVISNVKKLDVQKQLIQDMVTLSAFLTKTDNDFLYFIKHVEDSIMAASLKFGVFQTGNDVRVSVSCYGKVDAGSKSDGMDLTGGPSCQRFQIFLEKMKKSRYPDQ